MFFKNRLLQNITLLALLLSLLLPLGSLLHGNINFNTDLARDFLLIEDIAVNHNMTLVGPRSGGIPGVFHGPLWLYIQLPAFIFGKGNPVAVGWFWYFLFVISVYSLFLIVSKFVKIKNERLLITALYASVLGLQTSAFFNPTGAILCMPLMVYALLKYADTGMARYVVLYAIWIGAIIQFQMAFGIPMLITSLYFLIREIYKRKNYKHFMYFAPLFIFLSTFLVFELRHSFLQTHAVWNYLFGQINHGKTNSITYILDHIRIIFFGPFELLVSNIWMSLTLFIFMVFVIYKNWSVVKNHSYLLFFLQLWFSYFIITLPYKGKFWAYYYSPFLPVIIWFIVVCIWMLPNLYRKIGILIILVTMSINLYSNLPNWTTTVNNANSGWKYFYTTAEKIYKDAPSSFGYFTFSLDQYNYSQRYAMNYVGRVEYPGKSEPFKKLPVTYLWMEIKPHPVTSYSWWKEKLVHIYKLPDQVVSEDSAYRVEKYMLSSDDQKINPDSNILQSLIFR